MLELMVDKGLELKELRFHFLPALPPPPTAPNQVACHVHHKTGTSTCTQSLHIMRRLAPRFVV